MRYFVLFIVLMMISASCRSGNRQEDSVENQTTAPPEDSGYSSPPRYSVGGAPITEPVRSGPTAWEGDCIRNAQVTGWGGSDARELVQGQNLAQLNESIKNWNIYGSTYLAVTHPAIRNWDTWAQNLRSDMNTLINAIPDGYVLEIRGHIDQGEAVDLPWPSSWQLSRDRAMGVAQALVRNGVDFRNRACYSGVGSMQMVPDPQTDPHGKSAKNRRITFHIIRMNQQGLTEAAIRQNEAHVVASRTGRPSASGYSDQNRIVFEQTRQPIDTRPISSRFCRPFGSSYSNDPRVEEFCFDNGFRGDNRYNSDASPRPGTYSIQVGAFANYRNAVAMKNRLRNHFSEPVFILRTDHLHRVVIGEYPSRSAVAALREQVESILGTGTIIRRNGSVP